MLDVVDAVWKFKSRNANALIKLTFPSVAFDRLTDSVQMALHSGI